MSITCYIFRYTKKYIFNQKKIDINLNILNLQRELKLPSAEGTRTSYRSMQRKEVAD